MMKIKHDLRREYASRIAALPDAYIAGSDEGILKTLCECGLYRDSDVIFTYIGIEREAATLEFALKALKEGKTVCSPVIQGGGIMLAHMIRSIDELCTREGRIKLLEPLPHLPVIEAAQIDLVIAPCLSVDIYGNRLGYGGGYYDRYLKTLRPDCPVVCLCRDMLLASALPFDRDDVRVGYIATESALRTAAGVDI